MSPCPPILKRSDVHCTKSDSLIVFGHGIANKVPSKHEWSQFLVRRIGVVHWTQSSW
jgi:hypothetical protein